MFRRIPSFILALSLLLQTNPCASEFVAVSSLRPVNSRENYVSTLLSAGLEEKGGVTERARQRVLTLLHRRGVFKRTPEGITIFVAKAMRRTGPKAAYWRRSLQLRLEQLVWGGSFRSPEILLQKMGPLLQEPPADPEAIERTLSHLQDEKFEKEVLLKDYAGELLGGQETDWVLRMLWNSPRVLLHGSFTQGFLRPDSDVDVLFLVEGMGHPAGHWMQMEISLKGEGQPRAFFRVLHPEEARVLLRSSGLLLTPKRILIRKESEWRLNGESLADLFRVNHELRDGIRSTAEAIGQPLSETEIARQAIATQQREVASESTGLEEPGFAGDWNAQLQAMDQRIQAGDKVPLADVRATLRLYFNRSVRGQDSFFDQYLKTAERAFHENPARVWKEVSGILNYAVIRQKRESYPPEAALADATQMLLERFPRVERRLARSRVKEVHSTWDRAGARVVGQGLSAEEVYETLKRSEGQTIFRLPSAAEPSGWSEERLQPGARDFLQPGLHYALLRWSGGRMGVVPQSMLLEPSDPRRTRQFRRVLRETVSGNRQKESRIQLIQTFGPRGTAHIRFQVRRRTIGSSYILLMSVPTESGKSSPVSLHLPREFWGQVMELVPRWREGHLRLEVFALEPRRLVRVTQWQEKPPAFRRIGFLNEEWKVEESAQRRNGQAATLDPNRGYRTLAELARATALPEELLQELGKASILYRDQENRVPGELAILLQQIDRQIQAASYPLRALEGFLGVQRSAAIEAVRRAGVPVIRRPGQRQRLSRANVLCLVLRKKVQDWAVAKGGGLVKWGEAAKVFGVNEDDLIHGWRDVRGRLRRTPYFNGVPLWIPYEGQRRLTRKGFEGLRKAEETARSQIQPDEAILMDELKRRTQATRVVLGQQLFNAVRALEERGIPSRILEHPLGEIQRIQLVPRDRLDEMFQEMNHPTRWKRSQIQPDFWYSSRTAARLLHLDRSSLLGPIKRGRLQSKKIFNHQFILGASILSYRQPVKLETETVSAGLEERFQRTRELEGAV